MTASADLVMVYSLQRHGARNVLPKGALLTETDLIGGPTLLPEGQRQTYNAGAAFRARYLSNATCGASGTCLPGSDAAGAAVSSGAKYGVLGTPGVGFGNFDVYVRSSALDRTIMSGLCFFNGVFQPDPAAPAANPAAYLPTGAQVVPVYTQSDQNDILIRAYTKCPAYQAALDAWFDSAEFQAQADASAGLRAAVAERWPAADTSLQNWWNVYDAINVYRTYGLGAPTPNFTDLFTPIQDLAYWLEVRKMQTRLTRNLLGGHLLADLLASLQGAAAAAANGSQLYYKLVSLSGHYNTQLGLLAALGLDAQAGAAAAAFVWYRPSLPRLAAVLAFELHAVPATAAAPGNGSSSSSSSSSSSNATVMYVVRAVAQDGPSASFITVPLPCASAAAAAALAAAVNAGAANATAAAANAAAAVGACTLDDFVALAAPRSMPEAADWCAACGNDDVSACRLARLQAEGGGGDEGEAWKIAVSVVVTFVGSLLLAALAVGVWSYCAVRRRQQQQQQQYGTGVGGADSHGMSSSFLPGGKAAAGKAPGCFRGVGGAGRGKGRGGAGDGLDSAELAQAPFHYSSAAAHQI
ncbi:hypothetical protein HYH02_015034 [Chlamydomonas schloesseri]|uniref:Acid phosphatase n=1 Tax=Chlamydomonas schloesseri TaxID=2026947 RepID=A0A835VTM8_9CHLO|nr:hypothetical protein HYH02_015034 [Chlamydomonas schloesseri]|eukprot:KAG2425428.1 hypothetical protein HYH02_015034 [Chlamydomonas schloesseri]